MLTAIALHYLNAAERRRGDQARMRQIIVKHVGYRVKPKPRELAWAVYAATGERYK